MLTGRVLTLGVCVFALFAPRAAVAAGPVTPGVVVGANIASVGLEGTDTVGVRTAEKAGVDIGGFLRWRINDAIAIEPEVAYSQKHFTVKDTFSRFSALERWDWIEVPILARLSVWHTGDRRIYAIAGPAFGFRAGAKEDAAGHTADITDRVQRVDVSIIGGGGFAMGKAAVEVRYDGGVRDLNKNNGLGDGLTAKTRSVMLDLKWNLK